MARSKTPTELAAELTVLRKNEKTAKTDLTNKIMEAQILIDSEAISLLTALKDQISSAHFQISENSKELTFVLTFKHSDILTRPMANTALTNIREFSKVSGLNIIKGEK